jgi:hypothetical protein
MDTLGGRAANGASVHRPSAPNRHPWNGHSTAPSTTFAADAQMRAVVRAVRVTYRRLPVRPAEGDERTVNGQPGLVAQLDGVTVSVYAFDVVGDRIKRIWAVLNPDKLRQWAAPSRTD